MDMFPDASLIREIQQELDGIIQVGVRNITRLIRATEAQGTSTGSVAEAKTSPFPGLRLRKARGSKSNVHVKQDMKGADSSLSARLVQEGLLTPELLQQLQREWTKEQKPSGPTGTVSKNKKKKWGIGIVSLFYIYIGDYLTNSVLFAMSYVNMCVYLCVSRLTET